MSKILIIGGGGHAKVLISVIKKISKYEIIGYTDFSNYGDILGIKYIGNDDSISEFIKMGINNAALGIGQVKLTNKRFEVVQKLKSAGFEFPIIVSPYAIVNEEVIIGEGTQVYDGVVINSGSKIGKHTILNTNATIEHDSEVGDYCHIATGAVLSGGVKVGSYSMVGSGASVVQYKSIAPNCLIGTGGVVTKDITESGTYAGNPARKIK